MQVRIINAYGKRHARAGVIFLAAITGMGRAGDGDT